MFAELIAAFQYKYNLISVLDNFLTMTLCAFIQPHNTEVI